MGIRICGDVGVRQGVTWKTGQYQAGKDGVIESGTFRTFYFEEMSSVEKSWVQ